MDEQKTKLGRIPMNIQTLQLFAEGEAGADPSGEDSGKTDGQAPAEPKTPEPQDEKKYTDAEVDEIIDKKYAKWKAEQEAKESEAKKLAKMNADEKKDYQLKQREQELATREAEIARKELTAEARSMLSERDLPVELVDVVNLTDADSVTESINAIQKSWEAAVQKGVSDRLKGSAPIKSAQQNQQEEVPKWKKDFLK
nr:MAG TPA: capsid scaffolding protein [Caudoviricetes sp.]